MLWNLWMIFLKGFGQERLKTSNQAYLTAHLIFILWRTIRDGKGGTGAILEAILYKLRLKKWELWLFCGEESGFGEEFPQSFKSDFWAKCSISWEMFNWSPRKSEAMTKFIEWTRIGTSCSRGSLYSKKYVLPMHYPTYTNESVVYVWLVHVHCAW